MLQLIGLGLDDKEITLKAKAALQKADKIYSEFYTNTETVSIENLENEIDQEIEVLNREQVEREDKILKSAKERDTAFLVSGDPLTATTHYDIKHRAEKQGIKVEVIHAPSIFTSVAETGLSVYKFGRTVTLPKNSSPNSVTNYIQQNDSIGLHTLILLDINYSANKAAEKLVKLDQDLAERETIILERANTENQKTTKTKLGEAVKKQYGKPPHSIIITGEKSHKESEFIEEFNQT